MSKIFAWVASILLLVFIGGLIYSVFLNQQTINTLEKTIIELQDTKNKLAQTETKSSEAEINLIETKKLLEDEQAKNSKLQKDYTDVAASLTSTRNDLSSSKSKLNLLICTNQIDDMDYSSIIDASAALQNYVRKLPNVNRISSTMRNTLWGNAQSKVHLINYYADDGGYYSMQFVVYMDELGWEKSTFYIDGQCWIDPPY